MTSAGNGTVSGGGTYDEGSKHEISATAAEHYHFVQWNDGNTSNPREITVTEAKEYTATFAINTQPITITIPDEGGTVTGVVSGNSYPEGSEQTIEAVHAEHYHFVEWSDHITDNPRTITVGTSNVYTPIFAINTHKLLWNFDGGTPSGSYTEANNTLAYGSTITYPTTVTRDGYQLSGWSSSPSGNPETMPDEDLTITALWVKTYTITFMNFDNEEWRECWSGPFAEGAEIVYGGEEDPQRPSTNQYEYTFIGWTETGATGVEGEVLTSLGTASESCTKTFYARYSKEEVEYDIKWINWNGDLLDSSTRTYGYTPLPEYGGDAPTRPTTDGQMYRWIGWDNQDEAIAAGKEVTFTAQFESITELVATAENPIEITENTTVNVTIVKVKGNLTVEEGSMLTTEDLILEASNDDSGNILDVNRVQLKVNGHAYFDYNFDVDPWHWSAFGVPFVINLDDVAPYKLGDPEHPLVLGTDYDIVYFDGVERAKNGPKKNSWKYVEYNEHTLTPGVLYMIAFNKPVGHVGVVRFTFTKTSTTDINYTDDIPLTITGEGIYDNWNGIANPRMFHALLSAGVEECQVHDGGAIGKDGYDLYDMKDKKFFVGKAAFVHVPSGQSAMSAEVATNQGEIAPKAPRRAKAQTSTARYDVQIAPLDGEKADRIFLLADEEKQDEFAIVADIVKMGVSPVRAQMWVDKYGEKLCKNTATMINNQAVYPLGISVPNAGEYEIYINERPEEDAVLYLTFDGRPIWNLNYGPYTANLEKGTTQHYGLLLVRRNVPTDIDPVQATEQSSAQKLLIDDKVYIFRNGAVYTITGQTIK